MKLSSKLIAKILVLCGISLTCTACYGVPERTNYMTDIEGMVTDEATGVPIEGIKISTKGPYYFEEGLSDALGRFNLRHVAQPPATITVTVEDIDGPENGGEYVTQTRSVDIVQQNFAPVGGSGMSTQWEARWTTDFELTLKLEEDENE